MNIPKQTLIRKAHTNLGSCQLNKTFLKHIPFYNFFRHISSLREAKLIKFPDPQQCSSEIRLCLEKKRFLDPMNSNIYSMKQNFTKYSVITCRPFTVISFKQIYTSKSIKILKKLMIHMTCSCKSLIKDCYTKKILFNISNIKI